MLEHLDLQQLTCLNEDEEHTLKSIVSSRTKNTSGAYLLSDVDEQLLLNITVSCLVEHSLNFNALLWISSTRPCGYGQLPSKHRT